MMGKLDRIIRDAGPMDSGAIPDWMSSFEVKPSAPKTSE